jgi:hypothetical protein
MCSNIADGGSKAVGNLELRCKNCHTEAAHARGARSALAHRL